MFIFFLSLTSTIKLNVSPGLKKIFQKFHIIDELNASWIQQVFTEFLCTKTFITQHTEKQEIEREVNIKLTTTKKQSQQYNKKLILFFSSSLPSHKLNWS